MSTNSYLSTYAYALYKASKNIDQQNTYPVEEVQRKAKAAGIDPNTLGVYIMQNQSTLEAQYQAEISKQPKE